MENRHVKVIMSGIIVVFFLTFILGSVRIGHSEAPEVVEGHEVNDATETKDNVDLTKEDNDSGMAETSETVLENMTKKERELMHDKLTHQMMENVNRFSLSVPRSFASVCRLPSGKSGTPGTQSPLPQGHKWSS